MISGKEADEAKRERKAKQGKNRGDARAGYGKDKPPKGGRNAGGRGKSR